MMMPANSSEQPPAARDVAGAERGWRIGLTGGMGCGKSAVGDYLEAHYGWLRMDSDQLVRLALKQPAVVGQIRAEFGDGVVDASGTAVDRGALAALVFSDPARLRRLEEILHPLVREQWMASMAAAARQPAVVEIPLLHEKRLANLFDLTVCVEAVSSVQLSRLAKRGLASSQISARLRQQLSLQQKIEQSDLILSNSGSIAFLHSQIDHLVNLLAAENRFLT